MSKFWFALKEGNVHIIPVFHERVEFADAVRLALEELDPKAVAVELPVNIESQVLKAVARLPEVSVLLYESSRGEPLYVPVAPADPLVEALRWGLERGSAVHCVDVDIDSPMFSHENLPDPYAALRLGHELFYRTVVNLGGLEGVHPLDRLREQGMAFRVRRLAQEVGSVVLVCGMAHAQRILEDLRRSLAEPLDRPQRTAVQLFNLHPESLPEVLSEPPMFHALYEMRRRGLPPEPEDTHR
ncbi:MAG: hypothetical protein ACUVS3_08460, partial [Thermodesulfobacteriota bacterium]